MTPIAIAFGIFIDCIIGAAMITIFIKWDRIKQEELKQLEYKFNQMFKEEKERWDDM